MQTETLARFGHHPDADIDFELEVGELEGMAFNLRHGLKYEGESPEIFEARKARALDFRVGGVPSCVEAKTTLRGLTI